MKKNIKNLLILFIMTFCAFNINVSAKAITENSTFSKKSTKTLEPESIIIENYEGKYKTWKYVFNGEGEDFTAYCQDPQRYASDGYSVDHFLGTTSDKTENAMELGILEIIKNGLNQYSENDDEDLYLSTAIAIRALALGVMGRGDGGIAGNKEFIISASANVSLGKEWIKNYENDLTLPSFSDYGWYDPQYKLATKEGASDSILSKAKELFGIGITATEKAMNGETTTASVESSTSSDESYQYQTIEYKNFTPDGKAEMKNFQLSCPDCASSGIKIGNLEYRASGGWQSLSSSTNVLENISSGDGTIELRFSYSKPTNEEDCNSANYKITYEYNDTNLDYIGALLVVKTEKNAQRFYVIQKNENGLTAEIEGTITCGEACQTEITEPSCEGSGEGSIKAPEEIKKCIIQKNDDAGNTYKYTAAVDSNNKYCQVYCKEDYAKIKLDPVIKDVKCGGYFKLTGHLEGKKVCYTGGKTKDGATNGAKSIDKEQYVKDIIDAQKMMIEGLHLIKNAEAAASALASADEETCTGCGGCKGSGYYIKGPFKGVDSKVTDDKEGIVEVTDKNDEYEYGSKPTCPESTSDPDCPEGETCEQICPSNECTQGAKKSDVATAIENTKSTGIEKIETGMEKYKDAIKEYNACTTAWANTFLFQQKLEYYYDESHGEDNDNKDYHPYYDLLIKEAAEELRYLEKDGTESETKKITVCTKKANEKYECEGNEIPVSGNADESLPSAENFYYNSSYGSVFEDRTYTICTESECKKDTKKISQASFVKKEVEKKQDYITPTAFYQIAANGKITVNGSYAGKEVQIEALENVLPISTSTVGGGVFKIKISGLGEFYDADNKVGRLMDVDGPNYDRSVGKVVKSQGGFDGEYVCYYESPCKPDNCPDCEIDCVGEGCTWPEPTCPDCETDCVDCIMDGGKINATVKTISPSNFNSAEREYGYNWVVTTTSADLELIRQKAVKTITEIEEVNEMVYDKTDNDDSQLAFSITLTPEMIRDIKKYNEQQQSNGGYMNDSLTCKDVGNYKNLNCYSDFIDELSDKYSDKIVAPKRGTDEYWTLWDGFIYNENVIGGPSWK